jgi:HEAT repeat protein
MPPPKAPASRGFDPEAIEAVLKGMSPEEARKYAVEKVQKLAENPDAELEKLRFFLRGLGPEEDPPQVRVLRQILRGTANDKVRAECLYVLGQWVTDSAEVRDDALRTLKEHVADADPRVRADVARAFGQSGDVRLLSLLAAFLQDQDASVRRSAGEGACRLLAWKRQIPSDEKEAEAWMADLRERLKPILEALSKFEEAAAAQRPPAPAPAPAPVE